MDGGGGGGGSGGAEMVCWAPNTQRAADGCRRCRRRPRPRRLVHVFVYMRMAYAVRYVGRVVLVDAGNACRSEAQ